MNAAIEETKRRREIQNQYNIKHDIIPKTIKKDIRDLIVATKSIKETNKDLFEQKDPESMSKSELEKSIKTLEKRMKKFAVELRFEDAAQTRDTIITLKQIYNSI
ncbi:hypothetical protein AN640_03920 [Candidatus Epulonipiscium fishelsonii]|uniref:Uncharacterized protein n=2 Tax=Candidatus Epulonipiscium fishelsonii TaxID=77094 RepID=A0ACC8X8P9_9FIRM|nr:hypothetical protein AN640_00555 [Epulopiscium sp. SCG-D08WGA-EpuloA1]ONI46025.1 hypothetical protein AN640_03920 [Epulopiscium sp. SCG-D08WGA-EpuloA1]